MKLTVTPKAQQWFQEELDLSKGASVRFFGKYGGSTAVHTGFSTGVEVVETREGEPSMELIENGIQYYTDETDDWFFKGFDLVVDYDENIDEPVYLFKNDHK